MRLIDLGSGLVERSRLHPLTREHACNNPCEAALCSLLPDSRLSSLLLLIASSSPVEHSWSHHHHWSLRCLELVHELTTTAQLADGARLTAKVGVLVRQINSLTDQRNLGRRTTEDRTTVQSVTICHSSPHRQLGTDTAI